jgi:aspartate/methionine/tyrosine aminotransferase
MQINRFKLENFFEQHEFNVPYALCESDCESFTVKELLKMGNCSPRELENIRLGYTQTRGKLELREEISKLYSAILPEDIIVHSGAEEAIFIIMNVILNKGDHAIIHYPCYQSLIELPRSIGCEVTKWEACENDGWSLDIDFLKKSIKKNTRIIVINCPHNPTGYLMEKEEYKEILRIAQKNNIFVFSDEVYKFLEYDNKNRLPSACDIYSKGISLGVMSKSFGLAGLRIGWIALKNKKLREEVRAYKDYTTICNSAPAEFLSILALKNKEQIISRNLNIIKHNLELLEGFFAAHSDFLTWIKPKAGSIAFPKIIKKINLQKFCFDLIEKRGVLLLPGNLYDYGNKHFRIGFGRKNFQDGLKLLSEYINETKNK